MKGVALVDFLAAYEIGGGSNMKPKKKEKKNPAGAVSYGTCLSVFGYGLKVKWRCPGGSANVFVKEWVWVEETAACRVVWFLPDLVIVKRGSGVRLGGRWQLKGG